MNLETRLDPRLWNAVENSYQQRNYTTAIKDAIQFLGDLIRERSGLQSDTQQLVGEAFGGTSPKLKVNKLETDTEKNIQKGVEFLLRGIYFAIRNPRSHENRTDSPEDAETIILFINYLTKTIDQSKAPFTMTECLASIFDPDFPEDKSEYAELIVKDIPVGKRLQVFIEAFRVKETGNPKKLKCFFPVLLRNLTPEEQDKACAIVSDELRITSEEKTVRIVLQIMPNEFWPRYEKRAQIRIESKLKEAIRDGKYSNKNQQCTGGSLGTWAMHVWEYFSSKDDIVTALLNKLDSDSKMERDYVLTFFFPDFARIVDPPTPYTTKIINKRLKDGDGVVYRALGRTMGFLGVDSWIEAFSSSYGSFQDVPQFYHDDDDIPF